MRLSAALEQCQLVIVHHHAVPVGDVDPEVAEVIHTWSRFLAIWWEQSPSSIRECTECGEISFAGKGSKRKCWRCQKGQMVPIAPSFTKPRPRGRKATI